MDCARAPSRESNDLNDDDDDFSSHNNNEEEKTSGGGNADVNFLTSSFDDNNTYDSADDKSFTNKSFEVLY